MDAPQKAEEVGAPQLTQPPPVWTQPSQLTPAAGGATTAGVGTLASGDTPTGGGATPAGGATPTGGATTDAAGSSQAAMEAPSPDQLGPWVVRPPDP
jgi:hypothetical protein